MYCSTCGKSVIDNLNYCNSCGNRIEKNALVAGNNSTLYFAQAAGAIGLGGLIGAIFVLKILIGSQLEQSSILIILIAYLATVFLLFGILVGHAWKQSGDIRGKTKELSEPDEYVTPKSFRLVNTAQLEPALSVTENTTRTLEQIPLKRN